METEDKLTRTHHYLVLDSLRGVCACIVALFHFRTHGVISNLPFVTKGYLFVDFFFVLSGFVITASYRNRLAGGFSAIRFLGLRLGRVYPLHLFMLAVFIAFELFFAVAMPHAADRQPFAGTDAPAGIGYALLLVQIFVGASAQWNVPSWSIAAEFWTYAVFTAVFKLAGRALVPICVVLALGGLAILSVATDRYIAVFHDWALVRCIAGFSLGVLAEHVFRRMPPLDRRVATVVEFALVAVLFWYVSTASGIYTLAAPPLFMVVVVVFAGQAGLFSKALTTWPFLYVGSLSYSIYMLHYFVQLRIVNMLALVGRASHARWNMVERVGDANTVGGNALFGDAMTLLMLAVVIGASVLTYRFVELPGQRFSRARILTAAGRERRT